MPPKKAAAVSSVHIVVINNAVHSVYASEESAWDQLVSIKADSPASTTGRVETHLVQGGVTSRAAKKAVKDESVKGEEDGEAEVKAPKAKAKPKPTKKVKSEEEDNEDEDGEPEAKVPKAKAKAKPTKKVKAEEDDDDEIKEEDAPEPKAPARAAKAAKTLTQNPKAKALEDTLPENVKILLSGSGSVLSNQTIVVTGVPPKLGRQNVERLVMNYGGKLAKSISKNTTFVVVGRDAGPKKIEQIKDLEIESMGEDEFIEMLESYDAADRGKREGEEGEEDEKPVAKKVKK